jgi:HAD superfamily hydrolase (TIGR01509 family)
MIRGLIFDLDNTLVDSRLDFDAMRREMGLPAGRPILEAIGALDPAAAERCRDILRRHELAGAERATLLPGAREVLTEARRRELRLAIATRNCREIALTTLARLAIEIELVLTRDCGPTKPDPWPVLRATSAWGLSPGEVAVIGDYRFDIESGRAAGAKTVLLIHRDDIASYPNDEQADLVLASLAEYSKLVRWIEVS